MVGASLEDRQEALARLATLLVIGGPVILAVSTLIAWVLTGAALRPIEEMRTEAATIGANEPGRRLAVPDTADEVARLGATLNAMLERLETALERERRFVADAAHEDPDAPREPPHRIGARSPPRSDDRGARSDDPERGRGDRAALAAGRRSPRPRTGRGWKLPVRTEPVDLAELVAGAVRSVRPRADERSIELVVDVAGKVSANVDVLRVEQALGNLLDNSLRHTSPGGSDRGACRETSGALTVEVWDTGPDSPGRSCRTRSNRSRARTWPAVGTMAGRDWDWPSSEPW